MCIDWEVAGTIAMILTAIASVIGLFMARWQAKKAIEQADKVINMELKSKVGIFKYINFDNFGKFDLLNVGDDFIKVRKIIFYKLNDADEEVEMNISTQVFIGKSMSVTSPIHKNGQAESFKLSIVIFCENSRSYKYKQVLYVRKLGGAEPEVETRILDMDENHEIFKRFRYS